MKWLLLLLLIPALVWAHPCITPTQPIKGRCIMAEMNPPLTGEWQLISYPDEGIVYIVSAPGTPGQYDVSADGFGQFGEAILQLNTNLGSGATVNSVAVSRTRTTTFSDTFNYYLGTWAATPPAADADTFFGGTLAGTETNGLLNNTVMLDPTLINKTGVTSLRIFHGGAGAGGDTLSGIVVTINYDPPSRNKWPFRTAR